MNSKNNLLFYFFLFYFSLIPISMLEIFQENTFFFYMKLLLSFFSIPLFIYINKTLKFNFISLILFGSVLIVSISLNFYLFFNIFIFIIFVLFFFKMNTSYKEKITNTLGWLYLIFLILITLGVENGIILDVIYLNRHTMGFQNANFYTLIAFFAYINFLYANNKYMTYISFLFFIFISIFYTGTKTEILAIGLSSLVILQTYILYLFKLPKKFIATISSLIVVLIYSIAYILIIFSKEITMKYPVIDTLLAYRLTLISRALEDTSLSFIFIGGYKAKVDSFYLESLTSFGLLFVLTVMILFINASYVKTQQKDYKSLFLIYIFLFMSLTEQLLSPSFIFSIIIFTILFDSIKFKRKRVKYVN